jgi:hypothetical protein
MSYLLLALLAVCPRPRQDVRELTPTEREGFVSTLQAMKVSGAYDRMTSIHAAAFPQVHETPLFSWWHRFYLAEMETKAREHDPCFSTPVWNSTDPDWSSVEDLVGPLKSGCVTGPFEAWTPAGGGTCVARSVNPSFAPWNASRVDELIASPAATFEGAFEMGFHAAVHRLIGGSMGTPWSPDDPVFWIHHAFVDRVLALWQEAHPGERVFDAQGTLPFSERVDVVAVMNGTL